MRFLSAAAILFFFVPGQTWADQKPSEGYIQPLEDQYSACTQLVIQKPKEILAIAQRWFAESRQPAAQHCIALAQFELEDYEGAAVTLDALLSKVKPEQGDLWLRMKKQAIRAHMQSGGMQAAERHMSDVIHYAHGRNLTDELVHMLIERAQIYAGQDEHLRAIQDLDHALTIKPVASVILERARVYLKMGDIPAAEKDIRAALKADPLDENASRMLGDLERRMHELEEEAEEKERERLAALEEERSEREKIPPSIINNYYGTSSKDKRSSRGSSSRSNGEPEKKLSFDERVARAREERAERYGQTRKSEE